ncbi:hypothetical protein FRC12_020538, partial [Ceratobasidium sp. 428]
SHIAPSTRSKSKNGSNPGNEHIHSGATSTSTQNPPPSGLTPKSKCKMVLDLLDNLNITFGDSVLAVSYGKSTLRNAPSAVAAHKSLYCKAILSKILGLCLKPPLPPSGDGPCPAFATKATIKFIFSKAQEISCSKLEEFSGDYQLPNKKLSNMDHIATIILDSLHCCAKKECPNFYTLLSLLT